MPALLMGPLYGSSINDGYKDEPDLRVGNNGFLLMRPALLERLEMQPDLLFRLLCNEPDVLERMQSKPNLMNHLLYKPDLLGRLLTNPHLLPLLRQRWCLLLEVLEMQPGLLEHLLNKPDLARLIMSQQQQFNSRPIREWMWLLKGGLTDSFVVPCMELIYGEIIGMVSGVPYTDKLIATVLATPRPTKEGFLHISGVNHHSAATKKIGNLASKDIFVMSMGDDGGYGGSDGNSATHTTGGNHQSGTDLANNHEPDVIVDTAADVNVTGDATIFVAVTFEPEGYGLRAANGNEMECNWCGLVSHQNFSINYVYFSEDVGPRTIISGAELDLLGYSLKFEGGTCEVRDKGILVGKGCLVENKKYLMEYLRIPLDRVPVLQVPNVDENVPVVPVGPVGPLSVLTPVWTSIGAFFHRFFGSLLKRAGEQALRRPPV